ncbi:MAG: hypothetical protein M1828_003691 [Chrysothrix sp. TS-e1954]|nr:MAG: hypothetical protein M1828_003691 [Chrysothrix sp. TS-e1954]
MAPRSRRVAPDGPVAPEVVQYFNDLFQQLGYGRNDTDPESETSSDTSRTSTTMGSHQSTTSHSTTHSDHTTSLAAVSSHMTKTATSRRAAATAELSLDPVFVGAVGQYALNTSIIQAIGPHCKDATSGPAGCDGKSATIPNVPYLFETAIEKGDLSIIMKSSGYKTNTHRDNLLQIVANAIQSSATGKSCQMKTYSKCSYRRDLIGREEAPPIETCERHHVNECNAADSVSVQLLDVDAHGQPYTAAFANLALSFEAAKQDAFACEAVLEFAVSFLNFFVPESDGADPELESAIRAVCGDASELTPF